MKKIVIIFNFVLLQYVTYGQSQYSKGFDAGYKQGFCYGYVNCADPVTPVVPIPLIGESVNNYTDGYNRGFKMGLEKRAEITRTNNLPAQPSGQYQTSKTEFIDYNTSSEGSLDPDLERAAAKLENIAEQRRLQIDYEKNSAPAKLQQIRSIYSSFTSYPTVVADGWHLAIFSNGYDFCQERKVYVVNNKIVNYHKDDWESFNVISTMNIINGRTTIKTEERPEYLEVYFIDFLLNPRNRATPPQSPGIISFYTDLRRCGKISININGVYIGDLSNYFDTEPRCNNGGTISYTYKPGTYLYLAVAENGMYWIGNVKIYENQCIMIRLGRS